MANIRIPLQIDLKTRDGSIDKDQVIHNGFVEFNPSNQRITIKRPGLVIGASGSGTAHGTFYYDDKFYVWDLGTSDTSPLILNIYSGFLSPYSAWNSVDSYTISSDPVVALDSDGNYKNFYPTAPSTNIAPSSTTSPGNIYWSLTAVGPTPQYYGKYLLSDGPTCLTKAAAGYTAYEAWEPYKTCATKYPATLGWQTFVEVNASNQIRVNQWNDAFSSPSGSCTSAPNNLGIATYGTVFTV